MAALKKTLKKCNEVRLTEICKSCGVSNTDADCPTAGNEGSKITYAIPPSTIFDLASYINHVGEQVICVNDHHCSDLKAGQVYTIIDQFNDYFQYIRLKEFEQYPLKFFGRDSFKKCKVMYNDIEYTLQLGR